MVRARLILLTRQTRHDRHLTNAFFIPVLHSSRKAFNIAEEHLGIPALLDAEDMVKDMEPDRFSIATYLSQYYERFEGLKSKR